MAQVILQEKEANLNGRICFQSSRWAEATIGATPTAAQIRRLLIHILDSYGNVFEAIHRCGIM